MVGLGFFEKLGIVGCAGHLKENGADSIDGAEVVRIGTENILKFLNGLPANVLVLFRRSSGNVLAGVGSGEIQTRIKQRRVEILGLLEILHGSVILAILKSRHALIEKVPSLQFVATGKSGDQYEQRQDRHSPAERRCGP